MATIPFVDTALPPFARLLRRHRSRVGLTQRALADLSTISVRAIRDLELGRALRPRPDTVRLIADGLRLGNRARLDLELAADPDRSADIDAAAPPVVLSPQVGRDAETSALVAELAGERRLVTVVGLPGVGKTRLAVTAAAYLHAKMPVLWAGPDGTPMRDRGPADIVTAWSTAVRSGSRADDDLAEIVGTRRALLVLDGLDSLVDGGPVLRLLADCPSVRILLTAPRRCGLAGERVFLVSSLKPTDATQLLLAHAPAGYRLPPADRPAIARLCRVLDGLPAALAAVAPWLTLYAAADLADALEEDPTCLLDEAFLTALARAAEADKTLLNRLPPEFGPAAIATATGLPAPEARWALRDLVQRGLVRHTDGTRFEVPTLIRAVMAARSRMDEPALA